MHSIFLEKIPSMHSLSIAREFLAIGKAATAAVLVEYENPWRLFQYDDQNWLRYLYNNLNTSFDDFGSNKLSIVTFNYDRVVEFPFLHR